MDADLQYKLIVMTVSVVLGTVSAVAIAYGKMFLELKFNQKKNQNGKTNSAFSVYSDLVDQTYEHLLYVQSLGAVRSMVLCTRNGGGIPRFDKPLRVSILREIYDLRVGPLKNVFKDVETDHAYDDMLHKMLKSGNGKVTLIADKMKDGMLKNSYAKSGVALAYIYYLNETSTRLYYASFTFPDESTARLNEHDCDMEAKALKRIFKQLPED